MKRCTEFHSRHTRLVGYISESTVAIVVVQNVSAVLGHVKIGKAVVVVVAPNATETVTCARNAGCFGNISKGAVAIVSIKCVARGDAAIIEVAPIDEVDVRQTVAVEISDANTRTEYLAIDGDSIVTPDVDELDSGRPGDVCKLYRSRPRGLCVRVRGAVQAGGHDQRHASGNQERCSKPGAPAGRFHRPQLNRIAHSLLPPWQTPPFHGTVIPILRRILDALILRLRLLSRLPSGLFLQSVCGSLLFLFNLLGSFLL